VPATPPMASVTFSVTSPIDGMRERPLLAVPVQDEHPAVDPRGLPSIRCWV
jgi:hypothetical protein